MSEPTLRDCRILVVEDEYMLADELRMELTDLHAIVLGPVGTVEDAVALIAAQPHIDGAVLDVNLQGEMVYPAADLLRGRKVPFVFTTGYDPSVIPSRFDHVARFEKPTSLVEIARAISCAIQVPQAGR